MRFLRDTVAGAMGTDDVDTYVPFLGTLAIFLVVANNISIVPVLQRQRPKTSTRQWHWPCWYSLPCSSLAS